MQFPRIINTGIISHPINWITVTLMVIVGMIALNLLLSPWHLQTDSSNELNANSIPGPYLAFTQ